MPRFAVFFLLLLAMGLAGSATAQDLGVMGLYFDEAGAVDCLDIAEVPYYEVFNLYLLLVNPEIGFIHGYVGGLEVPASVLPLSIITNYHFWDPDLHLERFQSVATEPYPLEEMNILVSYSFMSFPSEGDPDICFQLVANWFQTPDLESPALLLTPPPSFDPVPVPVNYGVGNCQAQLIEGGCPVADRTVTWDGVKALYRGN